MSLLSMTDCSVAENRVQARYELDQAEDGSRSGDKALVEWVQKWGRALVEYASDAPSYDDVSDEVSRAESEATQAESRSSYLSSAIEAAIKELDKIESSDEIRTAIDKAIAAMENAL